jgi:hypothetical protein
MMEAWQKRALVLATGVAASVCLGPACSGGGSSGGTGDRGSDGSDASIGSGTSAGPAASGGSSGGGATGGSSSAGGTVGSSGATGLSSGVGGTASSSGAGGPAPSGDSGGVAAGSCLGESVLAALGKSHLIVGGSMQDATASMARFDLRYDYISGGLFDGTAPCASCATGCTTNSGAKSCAGSGGCSWWGCWQYDQDPPGDFVRSFASTCAKASPAQIPMISYYQILQSSGVTEGAPEVTQAATDQAFMARYFADWRFLLKQIGQSVAILHVEPDFWGYAEQHVSDPHAETAAVASANATDCASVENSIAGMGQCMVSMVRKYAPHALVGLHASAWSTNTDVAGNTSASFNVAGEAAKTAAFLAACGESNADLVIVETSDRDAGYYQTVQKRNTWWDATNAKLPDFHQDFAWVKALTEALVKPALYWQTPLGNASQNNTANHYQDNRVDYFFGHMSELAGSHVLGAAFGAGAGDQTSPESDGGNFVTKAKAYFSLPGGGSALCSP